MNLFIGIAGYIGLTLLVFWFTFVFFCAVMKLRIVRDSGYLKDAPLIVKSFSYITLFIGLLCDFIFNVLLSVVFIEPPQEWLTTQRVIRLKQYGNTWQKACANWLCQQLGNLDEKHCG